VKSLSAGVVSVDRLGPGRNIFGKKRVPVSQQEGASRGRGQGSRVLRRVSEPPGWELATTALRHEGKKAKPPPPTRGSKLVS